MKRMLHSFITVIILSSSAKSATITWDGGGDGIWSTAANWVGDVIPLATDDVVLDNSVVAGTYIVSLPAGNVPVSVNSLTITPAGTNVITFLVPITNTSITAFTATGTGDAVVLNNGAIFINSSGAASGTPVSVTGSNFFRINNGARYVHNTPRGHTTNLVARLSTVAGTETGIFEFDITDISTTVSLSSRIFGTLILSSNAFGAPLTHSGNGAMPLLIRGDFQINTGVTLSIGMSADFTVNGDYSQAVSSTFSIQNSTYNNTVKLKGNIASQGLITETGTGLPYLK